MMMLNHSLGVVDVAGQIHVIHQVTQKKILLNVRPETTKKIKIIKEKTKMTKVIKERTNKSKIIKERTNKSKIIKTMIYQ